MACLDSERKEGEIMKIRNAKKDDISNILELSVRFCEIDFLDYRDTEVMKERQKSLSEKSIETNFSNIYIAESDNKFLGYLEMSKEKDYFTQKDIAYIKAIAVNLNAERQGVGKQLMKKAKEWCIENNCTELVLDVFSGNKKAINFYNNLGFEIEIIKMVKSVDNE